VYGGDPPPELGTLGSELLAHLGNSSQDGLVQVFEDMKLADLMRHRAKDDLNRHWIQGGSIGGDAAHGQLPRLQDGLKTLEKGDHILVRRVVVQHLVKQSLEGAVIHNGQDTKRAAVEFVNRQIAGKVGQPVLAVGYNDTKKRFIVRNSWGTQWGQQGYFTLPYDYFTDGNLSSDFWTIRRGEQM